MLNFLKKNFTIILVLILALLLRIPLLNGSFWLDEAAQALEADRPFSQQLNIVDDFQPPLMHLLTYISFQFGQTEWWLRLFGALIPGLLTIWGTYLLGQKIISKKVGLLAALFLTTSSFHIFFSQELRPYSLSAVFVIWSWFFLLESKRVGQDMYQLKSNNPINKFFGFFPISRDFFIFLLLSIAGLYSSYLYPFVLATQLIFLLVRRQWRSFWYACIIPAIAFLPWLNTFLQQLSAGQALRSSFPGWENIVSFSLLRAPTLTFGKFLYGVIDLEINASFLILTGLVILLVVVLLFSKKQQFFIENKSKILLWLYFLIIPFILASIISIFVPVIQPKRVIFLLPFAYLLLSFLIFGARKDWHNINLSNWLLLTLVLSINIFGVLSYYKNPLYQRENWRHAISTIHQNYSPNNTIALFAYADAFSPWTWYEKQFLPKFPTLSTGNYDANQLENLSEMISPVTNYENVIVFDYLRSLTDSQNLIPKNLEGLGYVQTQIYDYPNLGFIRIFSRLQPAFALEN